jgi:hypothetical protein
LTALKEVNPAQFLIDIVLIICFLLGSGFFLLVISEFVGARRLVRMKAACTALFPVGRARAAFELFSLIENPDFSARSGDEERLKTAGQAARA